MQSGRSPSQGPLGALNRRPVPESGADSLFPLLGRGLSGSAWPLD
jgi:hypothetical protein